MCGYTIEELDKYAKYTSYSTQTSLIVYNTNPYLNIPLFPLFSLGLSLMRQLSKQSHKM